MFQSFEFSSQAYRPLKNDEGDEKLEFSADKQRHCTQSRSWYRGAFFILLVVNIPALLALFLVAGRGRSVTMRLDGQSILENLKHNVPVVFEPDLRFQNSHEDGPWQSLIPPGRGFVEISSHQDPKSDSSTPGSGHYAISMFHQLHCLASLQSVFNMLTHSSEPGSHSGHEGHDLGHLVHCFDYIRQAIMCAGDTALEQAPIDPDSESAGVPTRSVDGWGATHMCRDWDVVWEFAKSHRYRNDSGVL